MSLDKCSALLSCIEYYDFFYICKGLKGNNKERLRLSFLIFGGRWLKIFMPAKYTPF
jgi:hypothetical protein